MMVAIVFQVPQPSGDCLSRLGNPFGYFLRVRFEYGSFVEMFPCLIFCEHETLLYGNVPKEANGSVCNIDHFSNRASAPSKRGNIPPYAPSTA